MCSSLADSEVSSARHRRAPPRRFAPPGAALEAAARASPLRFDTSHCLPLPGFNERRLNGHLLEPILHSAEDYMQELSASQASSNHPIQLYQPDDRKQKISPRPNAIFSQPPAVPERSRFGLPTRISSAEYAYTNKFLPSSQFYEQSTHTSPHKRNISAESELLGRKQNSSPSKTSQKNGGFYQHTRYDQLLDNPNLINDKQVGTKIILNQLKFQNMPTSIVGEKQITVQPHYIQHAPLAVTPLPFRRMDSLIPETLICTAPQIHPLPYRPQQRDRDQQIFYERQLQKKVQLANWKLRNLHLFDDHDLMRSRAISSQQKLDGFQQPKITEKGELRALHLPELPTRTSLLPQTIPSEKIYQSNEKTTSGTPVIPKNSQVDLKSEQSTKRAHKTLEQLASQIHPSNLRHAESTGVMPEFVQRSPSRTVNTSRSNYVSQNEANVPSFHKHYSSAAVEKPYDHPQSWSQLQAPRATVSEDASEATRGKDGQVAVTRSHNVGVNFDSLTHIPNQKVIADTQEPALQKHSQSVTPRKSQTCHETQKYSDSRANTAIPSPLPQQSENNTIKSTVRHDSNVSSDSFSPNSSPSYTNKTMETPLLKHHEVGKKSTSSRCDKLAKYSVTGASKDALLDKRVYEGSGKDELCNTSLTKSISTPASLQAIVRFRHGSNMSLHHRIIRDMRRPSTHYPTRKRLLFRFGQVFLNAVALLAIAGGLAAYFRAYPSPVHYVNKTITSVEIARGISDDMNPAPDDSTCSDKHGDDNLVDDLGTCDNEVLELLECGRAVAIHPSLDSSPLGLCLPVIVSFCHYHRVSYNYTMFPNYIGHFTQRDAQQEFEMFNAIVEVRCYELAALFLCSVFVPKCGSTGTSVTPCSKLCFETKRRCGFFLDLFGLTLPDYLDCNMFPESPNPNVCIGYQEVINEEIRALKPACTAGFQCDHRRCIPQDWRCDGHIDCEDQSDELNCFTCAKGMIHCGGRRCISQTHMCDGVVDCPWGQDERNCIRLSERMGDIGYGQLHVFHAERQMWQPACLKTWDNGTSAQTLCSILGYTRASSNTLTRRGDNSMLLLHNNNTRYEWKSYRHNPRSLLKNLKNCNGSYLTVEVSCTNYVCGRQRRLSAPRPSLRVVGGAEASPGDWPFLVAILGGPEEVFYCAGVLIADQWVLTASHCVGNISDPSGWTIQLGITRRHSHAYFGQKMKVRRVVPHPMYNLGVAHDNDVALFQLKSRVSFHDHLLPVCLPSPHYELAPGTMCTVIGWGKKEDSETTEYEPAVNEVQVPVLNRELCNNWLQHRNLNVTEGMICAGYAGGGKDACQGDSGGPLLCRDDTGFDRWFVGGIVSWGIKCAHPHLPGVYTYVPRYVPWIIRKMSLYSN